MRVPIFTILIITLILFFPQNLHAQTVDASSIWIKVYGQATAQATLRFGNRIGNTFGLDTSDLYPPEYREQEPPVPVAKALIPGFECVWQKIRPSQPWGTFRGLHERDFRDYSSPAQKDTFRLGFAQSDNSSATISFKWPSPSYLLAHCDSLFLRYTDTSGGSVVIDMFSQDTLILPNAGDRGITFARIYKTGIRLIETDVDEILVPTTFSLFQNYPNPFNPETKIQYAVSSRKYVSLKIYDVLGREVATLVNEVQAPGFKSVTWGANGTSSGVYFYRLQAGSFVETKKMVVLR